MEVAADRSDREALIWSAGAAEFIARDTYARSFWLLPRTSSRRECFLAGSLVLRRHSAMSPLLSKPKFRDFQRTIPLRFNHLRVNRELRY